MMINLPVELLHAPVTSAQARDMVLEAQRLLLPAHPCCDQLHFVEYFEMEGVALHREFGVVFYHPETISKISLDILCRLFNEVFASYTQHLAEEHMPEAGTLLH
jgi:hypothetical protein